MHCTRCHTAITEHTARIYGGRCVPCHRLRASLRLRRFFKDGRMAVAGLLCLPYHLIKGIVKCIQYRSIPLPFTKREVMAIIEPVHGRRAAREYFDGLRMGFITGGPWMTGRFFITMGAGDGYKILEDRSQWPEIVHRRACKPINFD